MFPSAKLSAVTDKSSIINRMYKMRLSIDPLNANIAKWSNTFKQFVGKLPTNCLSVFDHFVGLALKRLIFGKTLMRTHSLAMLKSCNQKL